MMVNFMQAVSVRVPKEDLDWLNELAIAGLNTPSDKIRYLIAQAKVKNESAQDYLSSVTLLQEDLRVFNDAICHLEHESQQHSELLESLSIKLPEILAMMISGFADGDCSFERAKEVEQQVAVKLGQVMMSLLRLGLVSQSGTYNKGMLDNFFPEVKELVQLLDLVNGQKQNRS